MITLIKRKMITLIKRITLITVQDLESVITQFSSMVYEVVIASGLLRRGASSQL